MRKIDYTGKAYEHPKTLYLRKKTLFKMIIATNMIIYKQWIKLDSWIFNAIINNTFLKFSLLIFWKCDRYYIYAK